jgi:hypothetical protein
VTSITPTRRRRRRPIWVPVVIVLAAVAVLFAAGFGITTWLQRDTGVGEAVDFTVEGSQLPGPCETTLITPAEALPSKDEVVLNVYNSTKRSGLASRVAREFRAEGFRINKVENDPRKARIPEVAEIRFGPNAREAAELVEYYLAGAKMVELSRNGPRVDVSLGRGFTSLADGGAVAAVLATPKQVLTGSGCGDAVPVPTAPVETAEEVDVVDEVVEE